MRLIDFVSHGLAWGLAVLLYLLEPFWRIRLGVVRADRLGHLAAGPDILMRKWQLNGRPSRTSFVFFAVDSCNPFLLSMWKRRLTIIENRLANRLIHRMLPVLHLTRFIEPLMDNSCHYREMCEARPNLEFTTDEEKRGQAALGEMGILPDDWFVCIYTRDPGYLLGKANSQAAAFNTYRDCSIENYMEAAKWIAAQGGYVLRMGSLTTQPLPIVGEPRIIDYASKHRSDFLDIYLAAKCRFFLGCCSGPTDVAVTFGTPTAWANYVYGSIGDGARSIFAPKLLRRRSTGQFLTLEEIDDLGVFPTAPDPEGRANYAHYDADCLAQHPDIEWVENDSDDILGMAKDMLDMVEGRQDLLAKTEHLHKAYLSFYGESPHNSPYAARLSPSFAMRHEALILGRE
jgi:putative glycosyltransferase (TIGR04372 family)